jgi:hypothetical protein
MADANSNFQLLQFNEHQLECVSAAAVNRRTVPNAAGSGDGESVCNSRRIHLLLAQLRPWARHDQALHAKDDGQLPGKGTHQFKQCNKQCRHSLTHDTIQHQCSCLRRQYTILFDCAAI